MPILLYLLGFALSLPLIAIALALLALRHVIASMNILELLLEFLLAVTWWLPLLALALILLLAAGFVARLRRPAAGMLLALDVVAIAVVLASMNPVGDPGVLLLLAPALLSAAACGTLLFARIDP